jgi:hypothetical protein
MTLAFLPFFVGAQAAVSLDEAVQRGVAYLQGRFPRGTRAIVLPGQSETPEVAEYVNAKLGAVLVNGGWFVMVVGDDAAQESISREMERHLNFEVSQETELSIGKQLGAQIIISNTLNRAGQGWRLDIEAVWIESAQREGQWSAENIRTDPAWASLASVRSAGLSFVGNALAAREMQAIADGLRSGMQTYNTGLDLDERSPGRAGYGFTVTLYKEQLPPAPPANTALLRAEATIEFSNNGRVLYKTGPYYITETTDALIARRVAERLRDDQAFFSRVNEAVK